LTDINDCTSGVGCLLFVVGGESSAIASLSSVVRW